MSIEALSWAFNLDLPSPGVKLTLLALANYANESGEAYPSQKAMAQKTCLCERAIRTHLVTLVQLGLIIRWPRTRANGSFTTDLFRINVGIEPQRQNLPAANSAYGKIFQTQRQNFPNPAANSAGPESSLNTTITKDNRKPIPTPEGKAKPEEPESYLIRAGITQDLLKDFQKVRKAKKAPLTMAAIRLIEREAEKAGISLKGAVKFSTERNWVGFRADWYEKEFSHVGM